MWSANLPAKSLLYSCFKSFARELQKSSEAVRAKTMQLGLEVDIQQAIRRKIERMGLEVVVVQKPTDSRTTTSNVVLPEKMMCADDVLKTLRGLFFGVLVGCKEAVFNNTLLLGY